jgi:hypothetical protein
MFFYSYYLENIETKEKKMILTDKFLGEAGDAITYLDVNYIIIDYIEEFNDFEEPEDY